MRVSKHNKIILWLFSMLLILPTFNSVAQKAKNKKANIILIMVDDMGYSDLGSYGSEIHTPNLDKLANEGLRLTQFYNASICAPTRGSLLTGQYAHKAGMGFFDVDLGLPAYQGYINKESLTLAEVLKKNGYKTLMSGKWHAGQQKPAWPNQRGFDRFFGIIGGGANYFDPGPMPLWGSEYPVNIIENNTPVNLKAGTYYFTDEITNHAIAFLNEEPNGKKPFFLYLAYNAPHWPLQALPEDITKYEGRYDKGWDVLREERIEKQIELGLRKKDDKVAPRDKDVPAWESLTYDEQQLWASKREVYAAMLDRVDQGIGRLLSTLKDLQKDENTLIIFISDNGAPAEDVAHVPNGKAARNTSPVGTAGSFESQGKEWSHVSNAPLRSFKNSMYEGGISSPLIAWFPKKIKAGIISKGTGHIIDIAPTLYDLVNATYPKNFKGTITNPLVGESLLPVLFEG